MGDTLQYAAAVTICTATVAFIIGANWWDNHRRNR